MDTVINVIPCRMPYADAALAQGNIQTARKSFRQVPEILP